MRLISKALISIFMLCTFFDIMQAENVERGDVNFVIISDIGDFGGGDQKQVAKAFGDFTFDYSPHAIINLGDTFHYWGVQSVDDPGWQSNYESIYTAPAHHNLWYCILGNHDYQGNTQAMIDYTQRSRRWNMPARYYAKTFSHNNTSVKIIFIDSTPYLSRAQSQPEIYPDICQQDTAQQSQWLATQLSTDTSADWLIVAAHHPLYSSRSDSKHQRADMQAHIGTILAQHCPDIYISGDVHCFEHFRSLDNQTDYVTCTSGSNAFEVEEPSRDALFTSDASGFCSMSMSKKHIDVTMFDKNGNIIYQFRKTK